MKQELDLEKEEVHADLIVNKLQGQVFVAQVRVCLDAHRAGWCCASSWLEFVNLCCASSWLESLA
jgi:hypothetical protein